MANVNSQPRPAPLNHDACKLMLDPTLQNNPTTVVLFLAPDKSGPATLMERPGNPRLGENQARSIVGLTALQASEVREAMFICTLERVAQAFSGNADVDLALCIDIDDVFRGRNRGDQSRPNTDREGRYTIEAAGASPRTLDFLPPEAAGWDVFPQAPGKLGERLAMAWQIMGCGRVVFLGIDNPDIPIDMLQSIIPQLEQADFVIGKSALGPTAAAVAGTGSIETNAGCWVIAAKRYRLGLLEGIDWAAGNVYHQALRAAKRAELNTTQLPDWPSSDSAAGLADLLERLEPASTPTLVRLRERLLAIVGDL